MISQKKECVGLVNIRRKVLMRGKVKVNRDTVFVEQIGKTPKV